MKKFRIVRGGNTNGKPWGLGSTFPAESAREAVEQETKEQNRDMTMGGLISQPKIAPIIAVFELVPVPESEWK